MSIPRRPPMFCTTVVGNGDFIEIEAYDHEHAVAARAVEALRAIANADHAEDGGPECDHVDIAAAACREIHASGWK